MPTIRYPFGTLNLDDELGLSLNGEQLRADARLLGDLAPVLRNRGFVTESNSRTVVYKMYRGVIAERQHAEAFRIHSVRFDLTVMASCLLDREPNKTLGHVHPEAKPGLSYPELYQVLYGKAAYLLQKFRGREVAEFRVIYAEAGDAVLIPPNYGHVTVNVGSTPLVMANLVSTRFSSDYSIYKEKAGAAYYLLDDGTLEPNRNYAAPPPPITSKETYPVSKDIYTDFMCCPRGYSFLNDPENIGVRQCRS